MASRMRCLLMGILIGGLLICPAFAASDFPDVDGFEEFAEAVTYVSEAGIMAGDSEGNFNPYTTVTRAEMTVIICRMLNQTDGLNPSNAFSDVPVSHWANAYICKAAELGIVSGYGNGRFGPSDQVTYEQGVTMIVQAVGGEVEAAECGGYPDGFLSVAETYGLVEGVAAEIGEPLSRSDIAMMIYHCIA